MRNFEDVKRAICASADSHPSQNPLVGALLYADAGLRVLPVRANSKVPLIRAWQLNATTDIRTIEQWWRKFPQANVGIATGGKSGIFVIDVDCKAGVDGMDSILDAFGDIEVDPDWLMAITPTGGLHFYFRFFAEFCEIVIGYAFYASGEDLCYRAWKNTTVSCWV